MLRCFFIILLSIPFVGSSQPLAIENSNSKIYLQTDRNAYISGDTVWAKAYFTTSPQNKKSTGHINLWITDCIDRPISSIYKFKIQNKYSNLMFPLPEVPYTGIYYIHIKSSDQHGASIKKKIKVFENTNSVADCIKSDCEVYVEGGTLIEGIDARIIVKNYGTHLFSTGQVFDKSNLPVTKFYLSSGKIGEFTFKAEKGNIYHIKFDEDSSGATYPLPLVQDHGFIIQTNNRKKKISFQITGKTKDKENVFVVAQQGDGKILYQKQFDSHILPITDIIPTETLPSGILRLALFDKDTTLLAERLNFINNQEYFLNCSFTASSSSTNPYGENLYAINFEEAMSGSYAVSVIDANFDDPSVYNDNIYSAILLSNDLLIPVYYPPAFFQSPTDSSDHIIDTEMITNKWHGKNWENINRQSINNSPYKKTESAFLSGTVTVKGTKQLFANQQINVISIGEDSTLQSTTINTDNEGHFQLNDIEWVGKSKLLFSPIDAKKNHAISVALDSSTYQTPSTFQGNIQIRKVQPTTKKTLFDSILAANKVLEKVIVKSARSAFEKALVERYANGVFKNRLGEVYDFTDYTANKQPLLSFLFPSHRNIRLNINSRGQRRLEARDIKGEYKMAQLYLNELPVLGDVEELDRLNTNDIALIKVIPDYNIANGTRSPSILIYTRKGKDYLGADTNYDIKYFEGYSKVYSFYNPKTIADKSQPDTRNITIYWNNKAATSKRVQVIPIHFFNNGSARRLKVVVEGMRDDNKLTHWEKIID